MIPQWNNCCHFDDKRKEAVIKENRTEARFSNRDQKHLIAYSVDGCVIKEGPRCDYLLLVEEDQHAFFIELKGVDIPHALEQIHSTIDRLRPVLPRGFKISVRIVATSVKRAPDLRANPKYLKLAKKVRELKGTLDIKSSPLREAL